MLPRSITVPASAMVPGFDPDHSLVAEIDAAGMAGIGHQRAAAGENPGAPQRLAGVDFQSPILLAQSLRMLGRAEEAQKATREGVRRAEHMLALNPLDGRALALGSAALFHDGQTARAIAWSQRSLELYPDDPSALINAACLHSKMGQKEEALDVLERVFARGWGKRDWVAHDPDYDILRDHPRFKKLLARLK